MTTVGRAVKIVLVCLACLVGCNAFRKGDFVPFSYNTQHSQVRSTASDVTATHTPMYGMNRDIQLPIPNFPFNPDDAFKMAFTVAKSKFSTEWISIYGGHDSKEIIHTLVFVFEYSGGDITDVDWIAHTRELTEAETKTENFPLTHLTLEYRWKEVIEQDTHFALQFIFSFGLIFFCINLYSVIDKYTK